MKNVTQGDGSALPAQLKAKIRDGVAYDDLSKSERAALFRCVDSLNETALGLLCVLDMIREEQALNRAQIGLAWYDRSYLVPWEVKQLTRLVELGLAGVRRRSLPKGGELVYWSFPAVYGINSLVLEKRERAEDERRAQQAQQAQQVKPPVQAPQPRTALERIDQERQARGLEVIRARHRAD